MDNNIISHDKYVFKMIKVINFDTMPNEEIQELIKQNQFIYYQFGGLCSHCGFREEHCPGEHCIYVGRKKRCRE